MGNEGGSQGSNIDWGAPPTGQPAPLPIDWNAPPTGEPAALANPAASPSQQPYVGPSGQFPPPASIRTRTIVFIVVGALLTFVVGGIGLGVAFIYFGQSEIHRNVPGDAAIGECFTKDGSGVAVDCAGLHTYEVFSTEGFAEGADRPGVLESYVGTDICSIHYEAYTGLSETSLTSNYTYSVRAPNQQDWDRGDRRLLCVAHHWEFRDIEGLIGHPTGALIAG